MMDEHKRIWERQPQEPVRWFQRFEKFRLMEPVRSVAAVYALEHPATSNDVNSRQKTPGDWYEKASVWQWDQRAAAWDAHQAKELEQQITVEKAKVLTSGLALMHKRVQVLNHLTLQLISMTKDESKVWIHDVKAIGTGKDARQVDLVAFNDALYREVREYLTDIADEMGERIKKSEVSAKVQNTGRIGVYLPEKYTLEEISGTELDEHQEREESAYDSSTTTDE